MIGNLIANTPIEALKELLLELRIDKVSLELMANGYSPNRDGMVDMMEDDTNTKFVLFPVVQLSQKLAEDIYKMPIEWDD
jgi:hypothetical protein